MEENFRIRITKTKKEWKAIDRKIKELSPNFNPEEEIKLPADKKKRKNSERFNKHLNNKISHLINDYKECPQCVKALFPERNPERQKPISKVWHLELSNMAAEMDISVSTLIDRCIITPLLTE